MYILRFKEVNDGPKGYPSAHLQMHHSNSRARWGGYAGMYIQTL
jgi:hypothetical protein